MAPVFDATITVVADDERRLARAQVRGQRGLEGRSDRQLTQDETAAKATHVVENHGSMEDLEKELERLYPLLAAPR
jgi:dephospho-CoA kinase